MEVAGAVLSRHSFGAEADGAGRFAIAIHPASGAARLLSLGSVRHEPAISYLDMLSTDHKQDGLTLVELMVVIGIIGILAALLLSALSHSLQRARQIQCANNVRQLGIALHESVSDNHVYPLEADAEYDKNGVATNFNTWVENLGHQLDLDDHRDANFWNKGIWLCPSVKPISILGISFQSYGYNSFGIGDHKDSLGLGGHYGMASVPVGTQPIYKPPVNESEIKSPSEMMAIGDGFYGAAANIYSGIGLFWRAYQVGGFSETATSYARHQGKANVAFCDGHIESPTLQFLFEDTSDEALSRWNRDHLPHRERLSQ